MVSLGYFKHKQKTSNFTWQQFGIQSSLWIKINFDSMVIWKGLDKIYIYINLHFFDDHKASCLSFMKPYEIKEN
jgi:hypothetical protein